MPPLKDGRKKPEKLRSVRKQQSYFNKPANLKISIPLQGTEQEGVHIPIVKGRRPPQFTKHLDIKTKINLANSVARQQLVKQEHPVFEADNVVIIQTPKSRRRKRNVEVVSDFFENCVGMGNNRADVGVSPTDTKLPEKMSPGKKPAPAPTRKILTRKRLADSKALENAKRSKVEAETDTETCDLFIKVEADNVPVEPECLAFVEPLPTVVQPTHVVEKLSPIVLHPASEVVQPQHKKPKPPVNRLQPAAKKPPPMRQPPGRKRGSRGKQQNVQANIETPSIVELLKTKVTEPVVEIKHNQHNAPELMESSSVGSSSNLLNNNIAEAVGKTKQNRQNAPNLEESSKSTVGSSPNLLNNKVTEAITKVKRNRQNAPKLEESNKSTVDSSPNLLNNKITEAIIKTKRNRQNAPKLEESNKSTVDSSPNLLNNKVTEPVVNIKRMKKNRLARSRRSSGGCSPNVLKHELAKVKNKQKQQNAPGLLESRQNSVGSSPNLLKNELAEVKTNHNQHNTPGLPECRQTSVGSSPNLLKNELAEVKTTQNQQNTPGLPEYRQNSVGSSPNLLKNELAEVKTNQNQQNTPGLPEYRQNSVGSSPNLLKNELAEVKTNHNQHNTPGLPEYRQNSVGSSPKLLKNELAEVITKQNQLNPQGLATSRNSSVLSSLSLLRNKVTEAVVHTKPNQQNEPGLVDSRKSSIGSSSNRSWTRDISSSSNTTCIASVCSNDFVRINKKLPVLKLTNIDSEVKKWQNGAPEIAASVVDVADATDGNLSDTYDSVSSVSKISVQSNDSLCANSLHLSVSSSSQFTQSRRDIIGSSSGYAKAANKLSLTMNKLDQEIIKWMNSDSENVNANLEKFRDKMFDILDREFGVITHCRHLKEVLNSPRKGRSIDETFISQKIHNDANNDVENFVENDLIVENTTIVETAPVENFPILEKAPLENLSIVEKAPVQNSPILGKAPAENPPLVENVPIVKAPVEVNSPVENQASELVKDLLEPRRRLSRYLSNMSEGSLSNVSTASKEILSNDEPVASSSYRYYDHHDDDDALSLFAESISGFECTKINTAIAPIPVPKPPEDEQYIPKPVKDYSVPNTEKQTYCPTKIRADVEMIASKIMNGCEKQSADSTSHYKQSISTDDAESYQDIIENIDLDTRLVPPDIIKKPRLMDSVYESLPKSRSIVFHNVCFYNLLSRCRLGFHGKCRFLHVVPTDTHVQEILTHLDDKKFVQEYMLLRGWSDLRRRYGMYYVEECAKRGLTRVLVEMAYDYVVKARHGCEDDKKRRVKAVEVTLLHLNTVDLSSCEDLLKLTVYQGTNTLLCDVLLATMSITQNFSRFKRVFLNLTYFMVANDRTFVDDVVEHIMERVCILPFEEPLARAVIEMIRMTKSGVFENSMIGHFEKQISVNKDVFADYTFLKNQRAFSSMLASSVVSPSPPPEATPARLDAPTGSPAPPGAPAPSGSPAPPAPPEPDTPDPQAPASSPDTSNLDEMNKAAEEPTKPEFTIGTNPAIIFNRASLRSGDSQDRAILGHSKSLATPGPSKFYANNTESDTNNDSAKPNIKKWRNRSIFAHKFPPPMASQDFMHDTPTRDTPPRGAPPRFTMRPSVWYQMRPPPRLPFNQRQVTFKSPSNYVNRQPGPQY